MIAPTLADAYIAGWRSCRSHEQVNIMDPNRLPAEQREAWLTGFHDALVNPLAAGPDPGEAGYE